jgi:O-methyltransferase
MNNVSKFDVSPYHKPGLRQSAGSAAEINLPEYFINNAQAAPRYEGQLKPAFQRALLQYHAGLTERDCDFYHSVDLPSGRHFAGAWDLRGHERRYAGGGILADADFAGRRIIEFGPATGAISAHLAAVGELVAVDLPFGAGPELVPFQGVDMAAAAQSGAESAGRLRNSWWFTKAALKYQAQAVYADIYHLPQDLGRFDLAVFGALLLHLSNPFKALAQAATLVDDALIVTEIDNAPAIPGCDRDAPDYPAVMAFNEGPLPQGVVHWWSLSPRAVTRMLERLGFEDVQTDTHTPARMAGKTSLFTVVGRRRKRVAIAMPREAADGLPLPSAQARFLVSGTEDAHVFLDLGAKGFKALKDSLRRAGVPPERAGRVLDFGCGAGRILRHWAVYPDVELHGTDYQESAVAWCAANFPFAAMKTNTLTPPLDYADGYFNVIYCLSVFTHLPADMQAAWFAELHRILAPGGVIYFTAHGEHYSYLFDEINAQNFRESRLVVTGGDQPGTNICAAFHPVSYVQKEFADRFSLEIVEHIACGARGNPEQDSYLLRKKLAAAVG